MAKGKLAKAQSKQIFGAEAVEEAENHATERATQKDPVKPGVYPATISEIELKNSKAGDPMFVVTFNLGEKYEEIQEFISFSTKAIDISRKKLVELMFIGFEYNIKPVEDEDLHDILAKVFNQIKKFKGKGLNIAVKIEQELYKKSEEDGSEKIFLMNKPRYWYCGPAGKELQFRDKNSVKPLNPEDLATWNLYKKSTAGVVAEHSDTVTETEMGKKTKQPAPAADVDDESAPY